MTTPDTAPRSPTPAQFATFLEQYPATLPLWDMGEDALYPFLGWLEARAVSEQRDRAVADGPHIASMLLSRSHHNQVGLCVAWALTNLPGRARTRDVDESELEVAFELASRYWRLKNVMAEVRQGVRSFSARGKKVRITYEGNAALDTTDRLLDFFEGLMEMPEGPPVGSQALWAWISGGGWQLAWERVPVEMKAEYRLFAGAALARQQTDLPADFDIGGFEVGDAAQILHELLAQAWHSNAALFMGSTDPLVTLQPRPRSALVTQLARDTGVPRDKTELIVQLLTVNLDVCSDPCLTPLVSLPDENLAAMSSLILPGALLRNFTARLQAEPARFGAAGRRLGLVGSQTVAATLRERLSGAKVEERINVFDGAGKQIGDLDVVAFDPGMAQVVVFEVLWGIGPDGSAEVARTEHRAAEKRDQVRRLRTAVSAGARVDWPRAWRVPPSATYNWFILTPNVLPTLPLDEDGITVRSHQMLQRFRWNGTRVGDMVAALLDPPTPPQGLGGTDWTTMRYGSYDLRIEYLVAV